VPRTTAPGTLRWATWLLLFEAVAILGIVAFQLYDTRHQTEMSLAHEARGAAGPAGYAVVLALIAWQLHARRAWARGAGIVLELLLVPLGYTIFSSGAPLIGVPVILFGVVGAALLLAPSSREALGIH
jgi:hypothetical protein